MPTYVIPSAAVSCFPIHVCAVCDSGIVRKLLGRLINFPTLRDDGTIVFHTVQKENEEDLLFYISFQCNQIFTNQMRQNASIFYNLSVFKIRTQNQWLICFDMLQNQYKFYMNSFRKMKIRRFDIILLYLI